MNLISLENFDQSSQREPILTSPRSIEACRRQGIHAKELIIRSIDEIKSLYKEKDIDKTTMEQRARHFEDRRREKIKILLEERQQLIEEERQGLWNFNSEGTKKGGSQFGKAESVKQGGSGSGSKQMFQSTLIEKEKKQLEKMKLKQQKEIEQMMEYEMKMAEIRKKNDEKLSSQKERERERERELAKKRKELEEIKRQQEFEKQRKIEEETEAQKRKTQDAYEKEQEKQRGEKQREIERMRESKNREEEQKLKQEEFKKQTENLLRKQQEAVDQKKMEMEEKDRARKEFLAQQQAIKLEEARLIREQHEEMLRTAKQKNDEDIQRKREEYLQKQRITEEKRQLFEQDREKKKYESKQLAEIKSQHIKEVLNSNVAIEEKRREDFYESQAQAAERKWKLEEMSKADAERKRQEDLDKEAKRRSVKENNDKQMEERRLFYLSKMEETDEKVMRSQMRKTMDLKEKHNIDVLKRTDRRENVERIMKMQDYQREKIMDKILRDNVKNEAIKEEKANLLETRLRLRQEIDKNKQEIMEKFGKIKMGKLDPSSIYEDHSQNKSQQEKGNTESNMERPKFNQTQQPMKPTKSLEYNKTNPKKQSLKDEFRGGKNNENVNDKEMKQKLENFKMQQNHEMLLVLEEEQGSEANREETMKKVTDPKEKKRLEKIFGMERAKAQARIQELSEKQEKNLERMMIQLGI